MKCAKQTNNIYIIVFFKHFFSETKKTTFFVIFSKRIKYVYYFKRKIKIKILHCLLNIYKMNKRKLIK